jgi:TonB family protein
MKTLVITIMMLSAFVASHAQFKGVPFDKAISFKEAEDYTEEELYNVLIKIDEDSVTAYTYFYEVKSKGYYDALKRLSRILEANNISRSADVEDSYFPSHVDESDYNEVVYILRMESGWIERSWYVYDDNWRISMIGNDDAILVGVVHYKTRKGFGNEGISHSLSEAERKRQEEFERKKNKEEQRRTNEIQNHTRNAFSSGKNSSDNKRTGEGVTSGTGNQGGINGSTESKYYSGKGYGNEGISYGLSGRTPQSLPLPEYNYQEEGIVVVQVTVNRNGRVTKATPGVKGSTTLDKNLLRAARKAAIAAQFDKNPDAPAFQKGTITYFFKLQ